MLKEPVWGIRWTFTIINALRHLFYATQVAPLGTKQEDGYKLKPGKGTGVMSSKGSFRVW